jgi:hypothetical protein
MSTTNTFEPDYPIEREMQQREEAGKSKFENDTRLFRPRPFKDKEKFDNKLFFLLFQFNQFEWFKNWPGLRNYYLKLYVHRYNEVNDAGQAQQRMAICEPQMNKYATEQLSDPSRVVPAPFPGEKACPFCKRSNELWDEYRDAKAAAGLENLQTEAFWKALDANPDVKRLRDLAKEWSAQEKYYFLCFDYSRWLGETPREKDDDGACAIQAYFGPQALVDGLYSKQKLKKRFWDFAGDGGRAIIFTRDNKDGKRFCKYSVDDEGEAPQLDGETAAYLANPPVEDLLDPAEFVRKLDFVAKKNYVASYGDGSPTPRNDDGSGNETEPQATAPGPVEVKAPVAAARPRARTAAPATPPSPTPAAEKAEALAEPNTPPPPAKDAAPAPTADASGAPKRARVTWRS